MNVEELYLSVAGSTGHCAPINHAGCSTLTAVAEKKVLGRSNLGKKVADVIISEV